MNPVRKLSEWDAKLTADTVEWCPAPNHEELAACGTYQLDEEAGRRHGSLSFHRLSLGENVESHSVTLVQDTLLDYGVLDMKWKVCGERPLLALAASSGHVVFGEITFKCKREEEEDIVCEFKEVEKIEVCSGRNGGSGLCLSLDWNKNNGESVVCTSDSTGAVSIVNYTESSPRVLLNWLAHTFEAWIVCFGRTSCSVVYSGGDDCRLCVWDTRTEPNRPVSVSREHTMGVCSLQVHPIQDHLLASGSYDERILVWDVRAMRKPVKETAAGGGVWRVKWHPMNSDLMAVACMHDGFKIFDWHLLKDNQDVRTVCEYKEHSSLAYGVDWYRASISGPPPSISSPSSSSLLASCSFYDRSLHFWTIPLNARPS